MVSLIVKQFQRPLIDYSRRIFRVESLRDPLEVETDMGATPVSRSLYADVV